MEHFLHFWIALKKCKQKKQNNFDYPVGVLYWNQLKRFCWWKLKLNLPSDNSQKLDFKLDFDLDPTSFNANAKTRGQPDAFRVQERHCLQAATRWQWWKWLPLNLQSKQTEAHSSWSDVQHHLPGPERFLFSWRWEPCALWPPTLAQHRDLQDCEISKKICVYFHWHQSSDSPSSHWFFFCIFSICFSLQLSLSGVV